jgi:hypothetical protein
MEIAILKTSAISLLCFLTAFSAYGANQDIVLGQKNFYDSAGKPGPEIVYISGALTGDGIGYKNNSALFACYSDRRECLAYSIEQIGDNQMSSLSPPIIYPVIKWNRTEIIASGSGDVKDCTRITVRISRVTQDAVLLTEPTNRHRAGCEHVGATVYKWHLEDANYWRELKGGIRAKK